MLTNRSCGPWVTGPGPRTFRYEPWRYGHGVLAIGYERWTWPCNMGHGHGPYCQGPWPWALPELTPKEKSWGNHMEIMGTDMDNIGSCLWWIYGKDMLKSCVELFCSNFSIPSWENPKTLSFMISGFLGPQELLFMDLNIQIKLFWKSKKTRQCLLKIWFIEKWNL